VRLHGLCNSRGANSLREGAALDKSASREDVRVASRTSPTQRFSLRLGAAQGGGVHRVPGGTTLPLPRYHIRLCLFPITGSAPSTVNRAGAIPLPLAIIHKM
jgi:hypothetical protein